MNCKFNKDLIIKTFNENKNSHAFLINTNNLVKAYEDVKDIIKKINCKTKEDNCTCNICSSIANETCSDVIFVHPDGKEIKKEAINSIMNLFTTTPLINEYQIYVILNADTMNKSSTNKILKFLEEPEKRIIGFFITDKIFNIIDTIKSRCQIYDAYYEECDFFDYFDMTQEDFDLYFDDSMKLLSTLNSNKKYILINNSRIIAKKERIDLLKIFDIVYKMYVLKYEFIIGNSYEFNYSKEIVDSITISNLKVILKRIKLLSDLKEKLKMNVNKELFMNKMFLEWL